MLGASGVREQPGSGGEHAGEAASRAAVLVMIRISTAGMIVGAAVWHRMGGADGVQVPQRPEVQGRNGKGRHGEKPGKETR
jgi:hypothetical protein